MKKIGYFVVLALAFCATSCIGSAYMAGEPKDQIEDKTILGTWKYKPAPSVKKDDPMSKALESLTFSDAGNKQYKMVLPPSPQGEPSPDLTVLIHKVSGENFMTIGSDKEPGKYSYLKYKIEGKTLLIFPLLEEKAAKDKNGFKITMDDGKQENKPTEFKNEKEFRAMIAKNVKGKNANINVNEPLKFVKQ